MRIHPEVALLVCLCLWIPVAQSQHDETAPEDLDASGDDEEFSGSGSGDIDLTKLFDNVVPTEASLNTTNETWVTEAGVAEHSVTQLSSTIPPEDDPETPNLIDQVLVVHATQTPETQPTQQDDETTTSLDEVQAETTESPTQEPVVPIAVENTTPALYEEKTTVSDLKERAETTLPVDVSDEILGAVDVEATPVPLSTTSAVEPADPGASGDGGETTATQATTDGSFIEDNIIPEVHSNEENVKPDEDLYFGNEINPRSRAELPGSELTVGSSSDNESLLERKEVLAGVIAGGVVGLAFAVMLVSLMVYRMKKKDEGSYALDEHKHPNGYQKAQRQEEFLA